MTIVYIMLATTEERTNGQHREHRPKAARSRPHQVLNRLDIESSGIRVAILLVSTPAIFLVTVTRIEKNPKARLVLERARYIVILVAAALLGAYLHANHKDQSYESALRDGAVLACAEIAACKESARQYANTR
jgi:hypothetical protein